MKIQAIAKLVISELIAYANGFLVEIMQPIPYIFEFRKCLLKLCERKRQSILYFGVSYMK